MDYLAEIKTLLGIQDDLQDAALLTILEIVTRQLRNKLYGRPKVIPEELSYIITEASITRFNQLGSEGLKSNADDGHTMTWYDSRGLLDPYMPDIDAWNQGQMPAVDKSKEGRVLFF